MTCFSFLFSCYLLSCPRRRRTGGSILGSASLLTHGDWQMGNGNLEDCWAGFPICLSLMALYRGHSSMLSFTRGYHLVSVRRADRRGLGGAAFQFSPLLATLDSLLTCFVSETKRQTEGPMHRILTW